MEAWVEQFEQAVKVTQIDDRSRFNGFTSGTGQISDLTLGLANNIQIINNWRLLISDTTIKYTDSKWLNYLHEIFERYHLDITAWTNTPTEIQHAFNMLNLLIHACEELPKPQIYRYFIATWCNSKKGIALPISIMEEYGTLMPAFGSVCLNYNEVGKTLEDRAITNDVHMLDRAFQPHAYYSPDIIVRFSTLPASEVVNKLELMKTFYNENNTVVKSKNIFKFTHPQVLPLRFPIATLIEEMPRSKLLASIQQHQYINKIYLD